MHGHVLGQGHGEVKAEGQVGVPLGKAVNLLLGLSARLGKQHLAGLNNGGVQRGEAVLFIGPGQNVLYPLELGLGSRK